MGYGIVKADDEMFGNDYYTRLIVPGEEEEEYFGERPEHYFGVSGLVKVGENYHLMAEDDGHFWTNVILTEEECSDLKDVISKIADTITLKPNWKYRRTRSYRDNWDHPNFPAKVIDRGKMRPIVSIDAKGKEISFDVSWAQDFIKTLTIE